MCCLLQCTLPISPNTPADRVEGEKKGFRPQRSGLLQSRRGQESQQGSVEEGSQPDQLFALMEHLVRGTALLC